ncbi:MAG: hypothetical protein GY928_16920 [Colwellia sp.]|nr:hypothetical protein [Colwellia sp.]
MKDIKDVRTLITMCKDLEALKEEVTTNPNSTLREVDDVKLAHKTAKDSLLHTGECLLSTLHDFVHKNPLLYGFFKVREKGFRYEVTAVQDRKDKKAFRLEFDSEYVGRYSEGVVDQRVVLVPYLLLEDTIEYTKQYRKKRYNSLRKSKLEAFQKLHKDFVQKKEGSTKYYDNKLIELMETYQDDRI